MVTKIIRIDGTVVKAIMLSKSALDPNLYILTIIDG